MTDTFETKKIAGAIAGIAVAIACAVAFAPGAGARATKPSQVDVVGSGTIAWSRLAVLAKPKAGAPTWYRISVPGRPNGRTGWVRAGALELHAVRKRVIIYRGARRFEYWDGARLVRSGRVAVGAPGAETPLGLFYVTDKFDPAIDSDWAILGAYAFETSAYSKLTDWPGGGIVGVHGTPWPNLLGQAVSHGCVRLDNRDVEFLRNRVPLGTPVKIVR